MGIPPVLAGLCKFRTEVPPTTAPDGGEDGEEEEGDAPVPIPLLPLPLLMLFNDDDAAPADAAAYAAAAAAAVEDAAADCGLFGCCVGPDRAEGPCCRKAAKKDVRKKGRWEGMADELVAVVVVVVVVVVVWDCGAGIRARIS